VILIIGIGTRRHQPGAEGTMRDRAGRWGLVGLGALLLVIAACGADASDGAAQGDGKRATVVATTSIWGDVARSIVGGEGSVEVLIPLGADAHDFRPSARQAAAIQRADLVIVNGLGLEEGLADVLEAAVVDGANVLELGPLMRPVSLVGRAECDPQARHENQNDNGRCDPHVWMDPERVTLAASLIADELNQIMPDIDWSARADRYVRTMEDTDAAIVAVLEKLPNDSRKMVTNHDSFGYFATRYGFEIVGVVIPGGSTLADPSSADLADLVKTMRDESISVIFTETSQSAVLADAVAAELGSSAVVVELFTGSLGASGSGATTLAAMLLTNAQLIAGALG